LAELRRIKMICDCGRTRPNDKLLCAKCGEKLLQDWSEHQRKIDEIDRQINDLNEEKDRLNKEYRHKRVPRAPFDELAPEIQVAEQGFDLSLIQ
jgi:predicted nuclease with TOPRIM domain